MSDTFGRWSDAHALLYVTTTGTVQNFYAPMMTVMFLPFIALGLPHALFFALQLLFLWAALATYADRSGPWGGWCLVAVLLLPANLLYAAFVVPDVWVLGFILILAAWSARPPSSLVLHGAGHLLVCMGLFGFRLNAVALALALLILIAWRPWSWSRKAVVVVATVAAIAGGIFLPKAVGFTGKSNVALGLAWEYVSVLRLARDRGQPLPPERFNLNYLGSTEAAIDQQIWMTGDGLFWNDPAPFPNGWIVAQQQKRIVRDWRSLVRNYPWLYLRAKAKIIQCQVGLCGDLAQLALAPDPPRPTTAQNGYVAGTNRVADEILALNQGVVQGPLYWAFAPIVPACIAIMLLWVRRREANPADVAALVLALAYMATFFITTQAATYRYAFPASFICGVLALKWAAQAAMAVIRTSPPPQAPRSAVPGRDGPGRAARSVSHK